MLRLKNIFLTIFAALCLCGCNGRYGYTPEQEKLLQELDATIDDLDTYHEAKLQRLNDLKAQKSPGMSDVEVYGIYNKLFNEYYKYDIDSTITYARKKLAIARRLAAQKGESPDGMRDSRLCAAEFDLASCYILSGMYAEVLDIIEPLDVQEFTYMLRPRFYQICSSLYKGMAVTSDDPALKTEYLSKMQNYRKRLYATLGDEDIAKLYVWSEMELDGGNGPEVLDSLLIAHSSEKLSRNDRAIISYIIATIYRQYGENDEALTYFAESAINDLQTPIKEYRSLYELAELLYRRGDFSKAYKYINQSIADALSTNARQNVSAINGILPVIVKSYNDFMRHRMSQLLLSFILVSILSALLIIAVRMLTKRRKTLAEANARLKEYVNLLQEANNIKDLYLGRYIDMCSYYIGGLERYRSRIKKAAKAGGLDEVNRLLKSTDFIDKELEEFYAQFDASFLDLFPDFVEKLNALLCEDKQLEVKGKDGILTTELRVAALIRLGVTDSAKIAQFLRRSVSTIYNYRVKMRNSAKSSREDLEKQIMHIGRLS